MSQRLTARLLAGRLRWEAFGDARNRPERQAEAALQNHRTPADDLGTQTAPGLVALGPSCIVPPSHYFDRGGPTSTRVPAPTPT
jgi:hypothetical protein